MTCAFLQKAFPRRMPGIAPDGFTLLPALALRPASPPGGVIAALPSHPLSAALLRQNPG
ncbi:MAG TPA: hypothetical protein VLM91_11715 [Candidatus Methylomirabilis sp.]|nr:hypothetical protein [Candidatus Methylomirabilis sp.]